MPSATVNAERNDGEPGGLADITAFQRDILRLLDREDHRKGTAIRDGLDDFLAAFDDFEAVADAPNTYVKISSLPRSADEPWPYPDLHGYVRNLLEWFGADRLLLGSDYPWMDSWASYEECLSWVEEAEFVSARDLAWLSYRTFDAVHER